MTSLPVYVLIPTFDRNKLLRKTLGSLSKVYKPSNYAGTIIIENGKKNDAEDIAKDFQYELNTQYFFCKEANKSNALNFAISSIKEDDAILFFTDDDAEFDKNVIKKYCSIITESSSSHYFGGTVVPIYEKEPNKYVRSILPNAASGFYPRKDYDKTYFLGINWAARKKHIVKSGGFNPAYGPGSKTGARGQESRMQDALSLTGILPRAVPDAIVYHHVPTKRCNLFWATKHLIQDGKSISLHKNLKTSRCYKKTHAKKLRNKIIRITFTLPIFLFYKKWGTILDLYKTLFLLIGEYQSLKSEVM